MDTHHLLPWFVIYLSYLVCWMYENSIEMQSLWTLSVTGQWHPCSSPWCDSVCSPALRGWVRLFLDLRLKGQAFTASLYHSYGQNRILLCPGYGTPQTSAFCKVWLHLGSAVHDGFNLQYFSKPCVSVTALKATLEKVQPKWVWGFQISNKRRKSNMRPKSLEIRFVLVPMLGLV